MAAPDDLRFQWRGRFANDELNRLHAEGFGHAVLDEDWASQVQNHSLGWVTARDGSELVGFVNVPWDGATHAFVLDTLVANNARRRGIGKRLVEEAARNAREAGCEWLHVDFDHGLEPFYFASCGFRPVPAGLIQL